MNKKIVAGFILAAAVAAVPFSLFAKTGTLLTYKVGGTAQCGKAPVVTVTIIGPEKASGTFSVVNNKHRDAGKMTGAFTVDASGTASVIMKSGVTYACDGGMLEVTLDTLTGATSDVSSKWLSIDSVGFKEGVAPTY